MAIQRTHITEPKVFEQAAWNKHPFHGIIKAVSITRNLFAYSGNREEHLIYFFLEFRHDLASHYLTEMFGHATYVVRDRHFVIIQNYNHIRLKVTHMVQTLKGHSCSK